MDSESEVELKSGRFPEAAEQDRSNGKSGNPHNPYQPGIMWGLPSCVGACWQHHSNHSNWLADVSCCAQCRSCYVGYWFFTCYPGSFIVCISCGFSGTRPSYTLTFHLVLDDFEGQDMERSGDKTLKDSEMVLVLWKTDVWSSPPLSKVAFIKPLKKPVITVILFIDRILIKKKTF